MPDEPIIVSGGSVTIDFKDSFRQQPAPQGKQSYTTTGILTSVLVNDELVSKLNPGDVVTIIYNTD